MHEASVLTALSVEALCSAESLDSNDVSTIFEYLYSYNSISSSDAWEQRFPDTEAVRRELRLDADGQLSTFLTQHWTFVRREAADGWLTWIRPTRYERLAGSGAAAVFKLYLSPAVESIPDAVAALVETLSFTAATAFKIGGTTADLLRPDKIVAYFQTLADLAESAQRFGEVLTGVTPQGVPFTAEIAGDGLLSWGVDPPARARALGELPRSWREWICYKLAVGLAEAMGSVDTSVPAWQRALERLKVIGVDVERWQPSPSFWGSALR